MASPRDISSLVAFWAADAPADYVDGRVTAAPDLVGGRVAYRTGQGRVGPQLVTVNGRKKWRFGGTASPASLAAPVPTINGTYTWVFVLSAAAGGQVLAPMGSGSSAQLLVEENSSKRWQAFAGANLFLAQASGEQMVQVQHDSLNTGSTRLMVNTGSATATLQRRSLTGEVWFGRHGSNVRELESDVAAICLFNGALSSADLAVLQQWMAEGGVSQAPAKPVVEHDWSLWDGSTLTPLNLSGIWDGAKVVALADYGAQRGLGTGPLGTMPLGGGSGTSSPQGLGTQPLGTSELGGKAA